MPRALRSFYFPLMLGLIAATLAALIAVVSNYNVWTWLIRAPLLLFAVAMFIDSFARYGDYRRLLPRMARNHDFRVEVWSMWRFTRCGRNVLIAADPNPAEVKAYLRKLGYRWWHIAPDNTFTRNSPLLTLKFYKGALGL